LAWTHYREGRADRFFGLVKETSELSKETREMAALGALRQAVDCRESGDGVGQARALLGCAETVRGNIDLWDAADIAGEALAVAEHAKAADVVADASLFLTSCQQESGSPIAERFA